MLLYLTLFIGFSPVFASEVEPLDFQINRHFRSGAHLIYECAYQRSVCVSDLGLELCQMWREEDLRDRFYLLRCVHLKSLPAHRECTDYQYQFIHQQVPKDYCFHPDML